MPLSYRVDSARRLVEVVGHGEVGFDELSAHFRAGAADPAYSAAYDALIDLRGVTAFLNAEEMRRFAAEVPGWLRRMPSRRAIVVSSDLLYGMIRMLEAHTIDAPTEYRVFRDDAAARRWLTDSRL